MIKLQTVKGTHDLLGKSSIIFDDIIDISENVSKQFNFEKISTPILEFSEIFSGTLGQVSDIVEKEMYNFVDQGNESLTLRPEGTAPVARALISNSLHESVSQKFYYFGPMFRREKPQSGRLRQFNQFGIEYFNQSSYFCDLEVILVAEKIIEKLNLKDRTELQLNTIGNYQSRVKFKNKLVEFFSKYKNDLSEDSRNRLEKNPLRILDSKHKSDLLIKKNAPRIYNFLDLESKKFYESLKASLSEANIKYVENSNLVRGLDYYNHTAFEYINLNGKSQNTILAGGRYDGLVKSLSKKDICGVGWALGIERILLMIQENCSVKDKNIISIFATSNAFNLNIFKIINNLKSLKNVSINFIYEGSFKKKLVKANKIKSSACIILGEDEYKEDKVIWKDFISGQQELVDLNNLDKFISEKTK